MLSVLDFELPPVMKEVLDAKYEAIISSSFLKIISDVDDIKRKIIEAIKSESNAHLEWLCAGIASLLFFIQQNWTGPQSKKEIDYFSFIRDTALEILSLHDECNENMIKPEFLYLAKIIFYSKELQSTFETCKWWLLRANLVHQLTLEESSALIFDESEKLIESISQSNVLENLCLKTIFNLEVTHFYLHYRRTQSSEKHLDIAKNTAELNLELQGALGIRTKYQQMEKAQLFLKVEIAKESFPSRICDDMPVALNLNDDLRLEKIKFYEEGENVELGSVEEAIILTK